MVEAAALAPKLRVLPDDFLVTGQAIVAEKPCAPRGTQSIP
jgi:hypothetical protein